MSNNYQYTTLDGNDFNYRAVNIDQILYFVCTEPLTVSKYSTQFIAAQYMKNHKSYLTRTYELIILYMKL